MSLRWNKYRAVIGTEVTITSSRQPKALTRKLVLSPAQSVVERSAHFDTLIAALPRSQLSILDGIELAIGYPYVNHMILPWQDEIIAPADRLAYAESMLQQHYGLVRSDWYCEISQEKFGRPAIASAIRRDIVDEILLACNNQKLRVQRVQTLLSDTIDRHPDVLHADAVFVVQQADGYEFGFRQDGRWRYAFALPGNGQSAEDSLKSASIMANIFPTNIYLSDLSGADLFSPATITGSDTQLSGLEAPKVQEKTHVHL
ncbi:hypothetical protein [Glaciimonas sp. PAMC28666]|uniref:hypothetical protein n=1 Tax=Glaciimonas sp. PAMC28666 TaxID=2807626 RepID=UPI0019652A75|nr:hypothetical protein [Glaciimonas sp. PAMC28666]QRX82577.1 hypothetical protein JQN73_21335 [Glaciimonas sp. PAMC28666]